MTRPIPIVKSLSSADAKVWRLVNFNPAGFSEYHRSSKRERFKLWPKQVQEMNREDRKKKRIQGRRLGKSITAADEFLCSILSYRGVEQGIALVGSRGQPTLQYIFEQWLIAPFRRNKFLQFFIEPGDRGVDRKNYEIRLQDGTTIKGRIQGKDGQGFNCFSGDTKIITYDGAKAIGDLAGQTVKLLTRDPMSMEDAYWVDAPISSFGEQVLWRVVLKRHGLRKEVLTTGLHRWFTDPTNPKEVHTQNLKVGDRLLSAYAPKVRWSVEPIGVQRGIVFGDGSRYADPKFPSMVKCWLDLYGEKDHQLLKYFEGYRTRPKIDKRTVVDITRVCDLPREFKDLPSINESDSVLNGWLMGYFAADGHVNTNSIPILTSGNREHLEFAKDVATRLGYHTQSIQVNPTKGSQIQSTGQKIGPSVAYRLAFALGDLPLDFFLIDQHKARAKSARSAAPSSWFVESVEETDRIEEVFCAEVSSTKAMVLEDNLLIGQTVHPNIAAWFDEVQLLSDEAVAEIYGMLSANQKVLASGVPNGVRGSWAYRIDNNPALGFVGGRMTRLDDPDVTEADIEAWKAAYGGEHTTGYRQLVLGEWGSASAMTFDVDRITADLPFKTEELVEGTPTAKQPSYYTSTTLYAKDYTGTGGLPLQLMIREDMPKTAKKIYIHADHGITASPTTIYVSFFDEKEGLRCWRQYMRVLLYEMQTQSQVEIFHYLADTLERMFKIKPVIGIDTTGQGGQAVMSYIEEIGHPVFWANFSEKVVFADRLETDEELLARIKKDPFSNPDRMMVMMESPLKQVAIPQLKKVLYAGELRLVNDPVLWKQIENTTDHPINVNNQDRKYETDYTGPSGSQPGYNHDLQAFEVLAAMLHRDIMAPTLELFNDMWSEPFEVGWGRW